MIFAGTAGFAAGFAAGRTAAFVAAFAAFGDFVAFAVFVGRQAGAETVLPAAMPQQAGVETLPAEALTAWRLA
jgi:hypothetical protein